MSSSTPTIRRGLRTAGPAAASLTNPAFGGGEVGVDEDVDAAGVQEGDRRQIQHLARNGHPRVLKGLAEVRSGGVVDLADQDQYGGAVGGLPP